MGMEFQEQFTNAKRELLSLLSSSSSSPSLTPADFEKDDDSNHHIDFITAASNLRARVYGIQEADRLKTKRIAGRIIPAIATTTAAVSGLVCVELIKLLQQQKIEGYRNCFMNLGISMFALSEPAVCPKTKITEKVFFTLWDRWELKGDLTIQQFVDHFKEKFALNVTGIFQGVNMLFVPLLGHSDRLPHPLRKYLDLPKGIRYVDLIVSFENEAGDDVNGPTVRFFPVQKKKAPVKKAAAAAAHDDDDDE